MTWSRFGHEFWSEQAGSVFVTFSLVRKTETGPGSGMDVGQDAGEVTGEVVKLLDVCRSEASRKQLQEALGLKAEENFRKLYLEPALKAGVIEMTIPDKPRSSRQLSLRLSAQII